jgi:hypothetical protein
MNIGFYGHSNCAYTSPDSFLNLVADQLGATIVNKGVRQGSQERILFDLKKTKNLDVAVIFHSEPGYTFLPNCDRDVDMTNISRRRMEHLMMQEEWDGQFMETYSPIFKKHFKELANFINTVTVYKEYLYHPDAVQNRFYGSLLQIDKYLIDKQIPCVHVLNYKNAIPEWFKFNSGVVDYVIMDLCKTHKIYKESGFFVNLITKQGNQIVAEKLNTLINAACGR